MSSPDIVFPSIFFIIVASQLPVILSAGHLSQPAKVSVQMSNNRAEWRLRSTRPDVSGARAALGPLVEMAENTTMDRFNTVLWALWGCPCRCYGWQNEAHPFSAAWTMTRGLWGQWWVFTFCLASCKESSCIPENDMFESHINRMLTIKNYTQPPYSHFCLWLFSLTAWQMIPWLPWKSALLFHPNNSCSGRDSLAVLDHYWLQLRVFRSG